MYRTSREQREALRDLYHRKQTPSHTWPAGAKTWRGYRKFRATVRPDHLCDCLMVPWLGMWIGIERDGYTHS